MVERGGFFALYSLVRPSLSLLELKYMQFSRESAA